LLISNHPQSIIILDDLLNPPFESGELARIIKMRSKEHVNRYPWAAAEEIHTASKEIARLYKVAIGILGIDEKEIKGIEYWGNKFGPNDRTAMHSDVDEMLYKIKRRLACALAGVIYYAHCEQLVGGGLQFEDGVTIQPRNNRCVMFFGATRHAVLPVQSGERYTIVLSIWDMVPFANKPDSGVPPVKWHI
jgi:hypothetical protein